MISAILSAFFGAGGDITNKFLLGKLKLSLREYLPITFGFIAVITLFLIPVGFYFNADKFSLWYIIGFLFMCATSFAWNILIAKSLQSEPLHEYELIILSTPLVTVVLATIFLPAERNIHLFLAGIIASLALVISRLRKHHLVFSSAAKRTLLAVFLIAIESIVLKELLNVFSPALLYFLRVLLLGIIFFFYYRPEFTALKYKPAKYGLILASLIGTALMILKYTAFHSIGVIETTIILLLGPILTYAASYFYFKERRFYKRDAACALVIILCIIYASFVH